jgi:hypothetical protein
VEDEKCMGQKKMCAKLLTENLEGRIFFEDLGVYGRIMLILEEIGLDRVDERMLMNYYTFYFHEDHSVDCMASSNQLLGPFSTSVFVATQRGGRLKRNIFHERVCGDTKRRATEAKHFPRACLWRHK